MESSSNWETGLVRLTQLAPWLAWLWVAGSFVFALRLVNGLVQSQRLRYRTQPIPTDWQQRAKKLAEQLGINQTILFASTDRSNTPLTLGWLKPIVLIPGSLFTMMPTDQLEAILIHELAHIKRRDYLWNLIQSVAEVILFYHPAYWYISSVLERERELACDNLTVTVTRQPRIYAQALLQVAVRSNQVPLPSVAAAKKRGLSDRIQQITHPGRAQRGISALPFLLLLSMISLSLAAFSWYQPELNKSEGNLRSPDYIGYGQRYSFAINLPDQLASSSDEDYLIGQNNFDQKISSPWVYFRESTLYLLNGEVVDDPESIRMDAIHRFEVYYDPLPAPLQNLADKNYSTVVRAFSREYKPSNNKQPFSVSGQITTREEGKVQPVPGVKVEVKESGKQTITDAAGKFRMPATDEGTLIVNWPNKTVSELEINGREFFHLIAHTPKHRLEKYRDKLQKRLAERMSESALERDRKAIRREINALDKAINSLSPNNKTDSVDLSNFRLLDPANQPPLFVVNGVIQTNERSISALDPDNIASVEVLKEEEAQIWFGKEGDNGVVLIRTKNAPPPKVIKGNVFSGETQQPLAGVTLSIKGKELAVSDRNGYFRTEIPNYSPHFILSKDGYETIRHASNGYPSWPEKLYLRPVPPPGEITSLYQQFVVQEVSRTLYSINGLPHMNSDPIPKLTLKDIESIRVVNDRSKLRIPDRFDQIVHISTKASYQHTPISFSNANALYVIDGIVEENRNNLSDFQSGDIASTEVVKV
ncbi:MAG: M56 family metallopeptidase, partial [Bacteroidota bacterium]